MASTAKRLGEELIFSEAFEVLRNIFAIFRSDCLEVKRNIVYLQSDGLLFVTAIAIIYGETLRYDVYKEMKHDIIGILTIYI